MNKYPGFCGWILLVSPQVFGEVVTDGTVGPGLALPGPAFQVEQALGARVGENLFHSFQRFNLDAGESALFSGDAAIQNVISRVTGGELSRIDGLLRSTIGDAAFFFINPAGVVFGDTARIDVPGAFHVSTAAELRFADGAVFSALTPEASTLSLAAPEAFGFLGARGGRIEVNGSQWQFKPGAEVSFSARGLTMDRATLQAPAGDLRLVSVDGADSTLSLTAPSGPVRGGAMVLTGSQLDVSGAGAGRLGVRGDEIEIRQSVLRANNTQDRADSFPAEDRGVEIVAGNLTIAEQSLVSASSQTRGNAARVTIQTETLSLDHSQVVSNALASGDAGRVVIQADDRLAVNPGGLITSTSDREGNAGAVTVSADTLEIIGDGQNLTGISSWARGLGHAGLVTVNVRDQLRLGASGFIDTSTFAQGRGGDVDIQAGAVAIEDGAIGGDAFDGTGDAGNIRLNIAERLQVGPGGRIGSNSFTSGHAGHVNIDAREIVVAGGALASDAGIGSSGSAGDLRIRADDRIVISEAGQIGSVTVGSGSAGNVDVQAPWIDIIGDGLNFTGITSQTQAEGNAGDVMINAEQQLRLRADGAINSSTFADGAGGRVNIQAGRVDMDGGLISSETLLGKGDAGEVRLTVASDLIMRDQSRISTTTFTQGHGGNVLINANNIDIVGDGRQFTGITSQAQGSGDAGSIQLRVAERLDLTQGGINALTFAEGDAGRIDIQAGGGVFQGLAGGVASNTAAGSRGRAGAIDLAIADFLTLKDNASITSATSASGDAGAVTVTVAGLLQVLDGAGIDSSTFAEGNAGRVTVSADSAILDNGSVLSNAGVGSQGRAGIIEVGINNDLLLTRNGRISSATLGSGDAGTVTVSAGQHLRVLDGGGIESSTFAEGDAGRVGVRAGQIELSGGVIGSDALAGTGQAGTVAVTAEDSIMLDDIGQISSSTFTSGNSGQVFVAAGGDLRLNGLAAINSSSTAQGNAGQIMVQANRVHLDNGLITSSTTRDSEGNAGSVIIRAEDSLIMGNRGQISSSTFGQGAGGRVSVHADNAIIEQGGISSATSGAGDAGTVNVEVNHRLRLEPGGVIDSSTFAQGDAGQVVVDAGKIEISSGLISSAAVNQASGRVGSVTVNAGERLDLRDGSAISIESRAIDPGGLRPNQLTVRAPVIELAGATITAESFGNVAASRILIEAARTLEVIDSQIATSANEGDGGPIVISAGDWLQLRNSQITTSVASPTNGNGGDITVNTPVLVLETGFIQANTNALGARGGAINLAVQQLIPFGDRLFRGGDQPLEFIAGQPGFNVIQAAAPDGISGAINIQSPELSIAGVLANITAPALDSERLAHNPCADRRGSSLTSLGRGGAPVLQQGQHELPLTPVSAPPATVSESWLAAETETCHRHPSERQRP